MDGLSSHSMQVSYFSSPSSQKVDEPILSNDLISDAASRMTFADWQPKLGSMGGSSMYPEKANKEFIDWYIKEYFIPRMPELCERSPSLKKLVDRVLASATPDRFVLIFENTRASLQTELTIFCDNNFVPQKAISIGKFNLHDPDNLVQFLCFIEIFSHELFHSLQGARATTVNVWKDGQNAEAFGKMTVERELETMAFGYRVINELRASYGRDSIPADSFGVDKTDGRNIPILEIFEQYEKGNQGVARQYCMNANPGTEVKNGGRSTYHTKDFIAFANSISGYLNSIAAPIKDYQRLLPDMKQAVEYAKNSNSSTYTRTMQNAMQVAFKAGDYKYAIGIGNILWDRFKVEIRDVKDSMTTKQKLIDTLLLTGDCNLAANNDEQAGKEYLYALSEITEVDQNTIKNLREINDRVFKLREKNAVNVLESPNGTQLAKRFADKTASLTKFIEDKAGDPLYKQILYDLHMMRGSLARDYYNNFAWAADEYSKALRLDPNSEETRIAYSGSKVRAEAPNRYNLRDIFSPQPAEQITQPTPKAT